MDRETFDTVTVAPLFSSTERDESLARSLFECDVAVVDGQRAAIEQRRVGLSCGRAHASRAIEKKRREAVVGVAPGRWVRMDRDTRLRRRVSFGNLRAR